MGKAPSQAGYDDGRAGRDPDTSYDNSGVLDRAFEAVTSIITGTDQIGQADKADQEYHGGHAAGQADRANDN
jgi:hypothetical protein